LDAIAWTKVEEAALAVFVSPLVAFTIAFVAMYLVAGLQSMTGWADNARPFKWLQIMSAAAVSFGHGANDAQKTMGIITVLLFSTGYLHGEFHVPLWVVLAAQVAMGLGTLMGGWRIVHTMGSKITRLTPHQGFCAETGGAVLLFGATAFGIPVSTTHTITGCIMGVGAARRASAVRWGVAGNILVAWILTIPASACIAALVYLLANAM
jgi:PiT family inorganic phosphate transporter